MFSNCPKYIATREVETVATTDAPEPVRTGTLDARARELLAAADTAFVATRGLDGLDASHRGGRPGFLQTPDARTIVWPDYSGNNMFKTLGNIAADGAAGLTVVDPEDGTTLHVSGHAEFDESRTIRLTVDAVVRRERAAPLRWRLERPARNPPLALALSSSRTLRKAQDAGKGVEVAVLVKDAEPAFGSGSGDQIVRGREPSTAA